MATADQTGHSRILNADKGHELQYVVLVAAANLNLAS